ncbi:MAG: ferrous iron transport protein B [Candidatus Thermoplasmatota archaeon]|nr:ferrous iron transport protein B [Candidatus Thermoplasmatota archaeon]MDP7266020.1 ferrous iron transport protein B [Candidatus Thermoplasmatota archaeon]
MGLSMKRTKTTSKKIKEESKHQCHGPVSENIEGLEKIVLIGNPNVGKSLIFNKLTGAYVTVSNYPGTTVTIDKGKCKIDGKYYGVIDSPGMYSLIPITEEERIAKFILLKERPKIVLHVIDAKNLERMLPLSLQLIEAGLPVIVVVNMMDEAKELGIKIDFIDLEKRLGVPTVPMVATTGEGINKLMGKLKRYSLKNKRQITFNKFIESSVKEIESCLKRDYSISKRAISLLLLQKDDDTIRMVKEEEGKRYGRINIIIETLLQNYSHPLSYIIKLRLQREANKIISTSMINVDIKKHTIKEKISRAMISPITGIPILFVILYFGLYQFVGVFGAGTLVDLIEGTLFGDKINPILTDFVRDNIPFESIQDLIVGEYGLVTLGVTYAIAIIFPIVGTFFLAFSIIEDTGYLPRLSLLIDRLFKKIGLSGRAVIPMVLGLGCDTMATMVTRTQETKRERVIATLLLALAVPCSAQLGVIFAILSGQPLALFVWFIVIMFNFVLIGFLAAKILPGDKPSFYMELPPLRLPKISNVLTKTYTRMVWYFKEIFPLFIIASVLIWSFQLVGLFKYILKGLYPVVNLLGLPDEAAKAFLFGFFRRDYGAAGLFEIQNSLTMVQLTVAAVTLTLFVPCIAQLMIMIKERGLKTALLMFFFVLFYAFAIGMVLNQILLVLGVGL